MKGYEMSVRYCKDSQNSILGKGRIFSQNISGIRPFLISNSECPRLKHPELEMYPLLRPCTFLCGIQVNVSKYVAIVNHTSHPHVMDDGTVYNLGMSVSVTGPLYSIIKFPPTCDVGSGGRYRSEYDIVERIREAVNVM